MLWRRPKNEFDEIKNLYLVGGGTHPGSGLPVIYESARISSKLISINKKVFDPVGFTNHKNLWHRGYPLELINGRKYKKIATKYSQSQVSYTYKKQGAVSDMSSPTKTSLKKRK